jgi:hypothetical protein
MIKLIFQVSNFYLKNLLYFSTITDFFYLWQIVFDFAFEYMLNIFKFKIVVLLFVFTDFFSYLLFLDNISFQM